LLNFTFDELVQVQFLKFDLVSYWGQYGGGLQYFAAIPSDTTVDCNITSWTEWTLCCNSKRSKNRTQIRDDQCKTVAEVEDCTGDKCLVDCKVTEWSSWSKCVQTRVDNICQDCEVLIANRSRSVVESAKHGGNRCADKLAEIKTCSSNLCNQKETLLFSIIGVLFLLLILLTVGFAVFMCKMRSSAKKVIKKDVNPLYGVEEVENKNPRSDSLEQSYDYMG